MVKPFFFRVIFFFKLWFPYKTDGKDVSFLVDFPTKTPGIS